MIITEKAFAKINLFLEITGKRADGYHELATLMYPISICDTVTLENNNSGDISISCNIVDVPTDKSNIVYKSAKLFFDKCGIENTGWHIHIDKTIPMKAGLAGGSTDGAAVLRILNRFYENPFSDEDLISISADVGADVPFCVASKPMFCTGIGEIMSPAPSLPDCQIVVSVPKKGMQTERAYSMMDKIENRSINNTDFLSLMNTCDLNIICQNIYNCFESVFPKDFIISEIMNNSGALVTRLSGSGSAVYGIFNDSDEAKNAYNRLLLNGYKAFYCDISK